MSVNSIKDLSLEALDDIFGSATKRAREEARKRGLPVCGIDANGQLQAGNTQETSETKDSTKLNIA